MGNFNLILQHPKPQNQINGILLINKDEAQFFEVSSKDNLVAETLVASMERIRIEHASSKGILLSGIERMNGGRIRLQEWWLMYV